MNGLRAWPGLLLVAALSAQEPGALRVWPERIRLDHGQDRQPLAVLARSATGIDVDVTAAAVISSADPSRAQVRVEGPQRHVVPCADGDTEVVVEHDGQTVRIPVQVVAGTTQPPVSFANDVLPILTHAGCNAGSCHGAAAGKNGFGLSLFAFDPARDHRTLTRELRSRRIDVAEPELSLLLQKGSGNVPHQGGKKLPADTADYRTIAAWIAAGAPTDVATAPMLAAIEVFPEQAVLVAGSRMPFLLRARYQDGSDRDVTALARWSASNDAAAAVDPYGVVTAHGQGESVVLARFGGQAVAARVIAHREDRPLAWPTVAEHGFLDAHVQARLRQMRVLPAEVCSDAAFVRRLHFDLLGQPPTPAEVDAFVADTAADKRERMIDALLLRPQFAVAQSMAWAEVLRIDAERMEPKGALRFSTWLRDQVAANRPFDQTVREMLTASGSSFASPPANYWLVADQAPQLAEHTAQVFLGLRIQCAQCHDHPFENWRMDDYYGFAAFFGQVGRKRGDDGAEWLLWDRRSGDVRNIRSGAVATPRLLGGIVPEPTQGVDRRAVLADWLVGKENPWFARNVANRVWARLFGRGLVDPPDDVRIGNPPSHPALLQQLGEQFAASGFDLRALFATICKSRTYQQARHPEEPSPALFAGHAVRRLSAEQLYDAIAAVTGVPGRMRGLPAGSSAAALPSGRSGTRFLELFGRPARESSCTCDRSDEPTLGQTLHLIHGDTIAARVRDPAGRLHQRLQANTSPEAMLDELFLAAYARRPSAAERADLLPLVRGAGDAEAVRAAWSDVFWAVLNSCEFLFQH